MLPHPTFFMIHFNIFLPSKSGTSKWTPFLRSPHQNPVCTRPASHTSHVPCLPHSSWFDHLNNIRWGAQIMKLFIIESSPITCYLDHLRPKYPPQHPILKHPQPTFLPQCERPSFTAIQNNRLNMHLKWRRQKMNTKFQLEEQTSCEADSWNKKRETGG